MTTQITTRRLFTGSHFLHDCSLQVENGKIVSIEPFLGTPEHELIAPAFIDLQIYGAGGRLFSLYPEVDSLELLYQSCLSGGTHYFLPTVATNSPEVISQCISAVRSYWAKGGKGCLGLHLEGPWLNPVKRGAHLEKFMHPPAIESVKALLDEGREVIKMITLAPEICSSAVIQLLLDHNIKLSAGHSNATYEEGLSGFDQGIQLATHLFNAMSPLQHRAPGLVGAIFNHNKAMSSIIPDGYHVDWPVIKLAHRIMGGRLFIITDAVTTTDAGPYQHQLVEDRYEAAGVLSGSALSMLKACNNIITHCGIAIEEALRMCSLYPAQAFGLDSQLGKLEPGYQAAYISLKESKTDFSLTNRS